MSQPIAHLNAVATAVPSHDVHAAFIGWAEARLADPRERALFRRMAERSGIRRRWSVLPATPSGGSPVEAGGFYAVDPLPPTSARMALYAEAAPRLALEAVAGLGPLGTISHLVVASCTGFVAPGIDQLIAASLGLRGSVERTLIGFMGCYAAVAALRTAHHIVRATPEARVLVVTVELSSLHLQPEDGIEPLLSMLQFGDGAAAAIVSAAPSGLAMDRFFAATLPDSEALIRWTIGDQGFAMHLSGEVPGRIARALADPAFAATLTDGRDAIEIDAWAVHAGGRSILDAVESGLGLGQGALAESREVLARNGNMSSATLMFVLAAMLEREAVDHGLAIAFGPGLAAEGFGFRMAG